MDPIHAYTQAMTRRHFFAHGAMGLGGAALATLQGQAAAPRLPVRQPVGGLPGLPHFPPRARRAIYLFMNEGPSQMDLWDYKPKMNDWYDKDLPESIRKGQRLTTMASGQNRFPIAPSKYKFSRAGKC